MAGLLDEAQGAAANGSLRHARVEESGRDGDKAAIGANSVGTASTQLEEGGATDPGEVPKALQCRLRGIVKGYQQAKGYGFIDCAQTRPFFKNDVFMHRFEAERAGAVLPGTLVTFRLRLCPVGKPQAEAVVLDRGAPPGAAAAAAAAAGIGPPGLSAALGPASSLPWIAPVAVDERSYMGHIKSYNEENGFGFIECEELKERFGRDVFLHRKQKGAFAVGDAVRFRIDVDYRGFPKARNVLDGSLVRRVGGEEGPQAAVGGASPRSDRDEAPPPPPPRPVPQHYDSPQDDVPPPPPPLQPPLSSSKSALHPPPPPPPPIGEVTEFQPPAGTEVVQDEVTEEDMVRRRGGGEGSQVQDDAVRTGAEGGEEEEDEEEEAEEKEEEEEGEGPAAQNGEEKEKVRRREVGGSKDGEEKDKVTSAVLRIQRAARAALARRLSATQLTVDVTRIQFEPGKVGMHVETMTGQVESCVPHGQAERKGIQPSWVVVSVDEMPYQGRASFELLRDKAAGTAPYMICFRKAHEGPEAVEESTTATTATCSVSEEASCQPWQRYLASSESGFWWWHDSTGDWFMEKEPGPWQRFSDPNSGDLYWWKDDESWFFEATGCH